MNTQANTIEAYIEQLPPDRKEPFEKLYQVITDNLGQGFEATMQYGMPSFVVPLSLYPSGYHCKPSEPLPFVSITDQKQGIHLYHMGLYGDPDVLAWFTEQYPRHSARKLDMGKSCVRFKGGKDIPYDLIGELMQKISVEDYISMYEQARRK